jgi:outer membrane immunogenic protein
VVRIYSICALAVIAVPAAAAAADFGKGPIYPAASADAWRGSYVGLIGGLGWAEARDTRWIGGIYAGYNFGLGSNVVFGVEADGTLTSVSVETGATQIQNPWDGTFRARVGYGNSNAMLYATGGLAVGSVKETAAGVVESATKTGWTAGFGVEAMLRANATARVEYRYTDLGTATFSSNPPVAYRSNDILIGLDLRLF